MILLLQPFEYFRANQIPNCLSEPMLRKSPTCPSHCLKTCGRPHERCQWTPRWGKLVPVTDPSKPFYRKNADSCFDPVLTSGAMNKEVTAKGVCCLPCSYNMNINFVTGRHVHLILNLVSSGLCVYVCIVCQTVKSFYGRVWKMPSKCTKGLLNWSVKNGPVWKIFWYRSAVVFVTLFLIYVFKKAER